MSASSFFRLDFPSERTFSDRISTSMILLKFSGQKISDATQWSNVQSLKVDTLMLYGVRLVCERRISKLCIL